MYKYKIAWVKKNKYQIIEYVEDGEEVFLKVVFTGNINEVEEQLKWLRNGKL